MSTDTTKTKKRAAKCMCCHFTGAGHLRTLQWARESGCDWNSDTCHAAAKLNLQVKNMNLSTRGSLLGHLHTLHWAREHGCDWDWWTCSVALESGHLELLKWAIVPGCSMEEDNDDGDYYYDDGPFSLCEFAADIGYWSTVKLAWDHGCSCSDRIKLQCTQHQLQLSL